MDRTQLKAGFFFQVSKNGEIPGLDSWIGALKRWAFSNANRKAMLPGPKRVTERRTEQQNKVTMGLWMDLILEELGYEPTDKDWIYGVLKLEMGYCEDRINKRTGEKISVPKKTRDLDKVAYSKFMEDFARNMAVNHEITLPDPVAAMAVI